MMSMARARAIAAHNGKADDGSTVWAGYVRTYVLPHCSVAEVWMLCDAIREVSTYPEHVPTKDSVLAPYARHWVDGWLA